MKSKNSFIKKAIAITISFEMILNTSNCNMFIFANIHSKDGDSPLTEVLDQPENPKDEYLSMFPEDTYSSFLDEGSIESPDAEPGEVNDELVLEEIVDIEEAPEEDVHFFSSPIVSEGEFKSYSIDSDELQSLLEDKDIESISDDLEYDDDYAEIVIEDSDFTQSADAKEDNNDVFGGDESSSFEEETNDPQSMPEEGFLFEEGNAEDIEDLTLENPDQEEDLTYDEEMVIENNDLEDGIDLFEEVLTEAEGTLWSQEELITVNEGTCGEELVWKYVEEIGLLQIDGAGDMDDYVDPSAVPWSAFQNEIREIVIADGVTSIGMYAFSDLTALEKVSITDDITSIGFRAFYNCISLTDINIPTGWMDCPTSKEGTIDSNCCGHIFEGCESLTQVVLPVQMELIPSYGFCYCDYLETIVLPENLTEIKNHTFYECTKLQSIELPASITYIGKSAFCYCGNLANITIQDGITELASYAFYECTSVDKISLPDSIEKIGYQAFAFCSNLSEINIPKEWNECPSNDKNGTVNGDYCGHIFEECKKLNSITVPEGVTELPGFAFNKCNYLTEVILPTSLISIKNHAFYKCSNLLNITIPTGVTYIGKSAFCYCNKLNSVVIPDGVKNIYAYGFYECKSLESLSLPDSVEQIGYQAFAYCTKLQSVHIPAGWTTCISSSTSGTISTEYCGHLFEGCSSLKSVELPAEWVSLPSYAFTACNYIEEISLPNGLNNVSNHSFYGCSRLKSIDLPNGITSINKSAFYGCDALAGLVVPEGTTSIGCFAFFSCSKIDEIQLADSVEQIGYKAFADCENLERINIPLNWNECFSSSTSSTGTNYQGNVFSGCAMLTQVSVPEGKASIPDYAFCNCSSLRDVFLPDSLTSIGNYAFYGCNSLTSINIPNGVSIIPKSAFSNCSSLLVVNVPQSIDAIEQNAFNNCASLEKINYASTEANWNNIAVNTSGNASISAVTFNYGFSIEFTEEDFLGIWEGEYDGNSGDTIVRRHFVVIFDSCIRECNVGKLSGTVTISPSEKADSQYDANGSYYFSGTVNMQTGVFFYQGHTWIHYPDGYDNFQFVTFDGFFGLDKVSIFGINDKTSSRTFEADLLGVPNTTNTQVILSRSGNRYNILQEEQQVESGADEYLTVTVIPDWQEYTKGTIRLFQRTMAIESKSGVFIDLQLGKLFSPSEKIYVALVDETGKTVEIKRTKLTISSSEQHGDITVTLDANGGSTHEAWSPNVYTMTFSIGEKYGYLPNPTRKGYRFAGWYTKKVGGTQITSTSVVQGSVKTLYARWKFSSLSVDIISSWGRTFRAVFDQDYFYTDSSTVQDGLMMLSALGAYSTYYQAEGRLFQTVDNPLVMLEECGFDHTTAMFSENGKADGHSNAINYNHGYVYIGKREIINNDGNKDLLIGVFISGYSDGGYEWVSNFNVGAQNYHSGFNSAANEILKLIKKYKKDYFKKDKYDSVKYWITGHSRGGALTNIVSINLGDDKNVYAYGFATPRYIYNETDLSGIHDNIINVISPDDFVPQVAPEKWGFKRYGQNLEFNSSYRQVMKSKFFACFSKEYEGYTTKEMMNLINAFTDIAASREEFNNRKYYKIKESTGLIGPFSIDTLIPYEWAQGGIGYAMSDMMPLGVVELAKACTFGKPFILANAMLVRDVLVSPKITDAHIMESYLMWLFSGVERIPEQAKYTGGGGIR